MDSTSTGPECSHFFWALVSYWAVIVEIGPSLMISSGNDPDPCRFRYIHASKFQVLNRAKSHFLFVAMEFHFTKARYEPKINFLSLGN